MRKIPDGKRAWLMKELPILESAGVLTREKACDLRRYYEANTRNGVHWAVTAFAVLGSLLISSGIILLFAHNWEDLSRPLRALLSVCPLAVGALLSLAALAKNGETAWRESAGLFHALAIGASIALIGQTYHLPSDIPAFLLTWALLILPLMFLLRATGAGLIYLALVCAWSAAAQQTYGQAAAFWLLILPPAARTVHLLRTNRHGAETLLHLVGLLLALYAGTGIVFERTVPGLWIVAYAALLSTTGLLGLSLYGDRDGWSNCPKIFGVIGMAALAYLFTWSGMWQEIGWEHVRHGWQYRPWGIWLDGGITLAFLAGWAAAALRAFRRDSVETVILALFPAIAILCFANGSMTKHANTANALIFNAFMLSLGIMYMVLGCRNAKLRQLNGGMGILSLLLLTRFFDTGFTYIARGIVFIVLGTIFLSVNLVMARRKKIGRGPHMNKTSAFLLAVVILVQFAVIAALIRGKERILREGDVFLFKTLPIDPSDPFQGRYVQLRFEANRISGKSGQDSGLEYREPLFALIESDADGFAFFSGWSRDKPASGAFLRTRYLGDQGKWDQAGRRSAQKAIRISLPFDRYYMNEAKAPQAEKAVWEATRGTNCWASVRILQGKAVVEDVFVRGRPLRDLAAQRDKEQP